MASIAKRHPVAHAHAYCRRVKAGARLELTAPIASAEKPTQQTHQENIPKASQKAKINRKGTEFHAKRTIVVEYLKQMNKWKKQFKEDKFFRYRVISRRYLRKLSLQPSPPQIETQRRKISWGEQVEILVFDSELEPSIISENQSFLETLIKPH